LVGLIYFYIVFIFLKRGCKFNYENNDKMALLEFNNADRNSVLKGRIKRLTVSSD